MSIQPNQRTYIHQTNSDEEKEKEKKIKSQSNEKKKKKDSHIRRKKREKEEKKNYCLGEVLIRAKKLSCARIKPGYVVGGAAAAPQPLIY